MHFESICSYPNLEFTFPVFFQCNNVLQWEDGDFIISDNLAVGHEATPETQLPRDVVGLRVLHRTTIKGTVPPAK
jgi:alpha-ketoglutarate-dependent taurine dioxygenase